MQTLPKRSLKVIHIGSHYVWQKSLYTLPVTVTFDAICHDAKDELIPAFSFTKQEWGKDECDALTWYASPNRADFTFRTGLFGGFPSVTRAQKSGRTWEFKPNVGEKFTMKCHITSTSAKYWINGEEYASSTYLEGTVPSQGYFGFATYGKENIDIENLTVTAQEVMPSLDPGEVTGLTLQATGTFVILNEVLSGNELGSTDVTQAEAEMMLQNAVTVYRKTPSLKALKKDYVYAAIDKVYNQARADLTRLFDEEIAEQSLIAASQAAMSIGSILSFFPPAALIADSASLATFATALGLQIDISVEGSKIIEQASSMRQNVDKEPALAPVKVWNDARTAELTTLGRLKAAPTSFRSASFLYTIIMLIVQQNPSYTDAQIIEEMRSLFKDVAEIAQSYPNFGQTLATIVSTEDDKVISDSIQKIVIASTKTSQLIGGVIGFIGVAVILTYKGYKNFKFIRDTQAAIERGANISTSPLNEAEQKLVDQNFVRNLSTLEIGMAATLAVVSAVAAGVEIWQAIETTKEKHNALQVLEENRDAIRTYYGTLIDHQY